MVLDTENALFQEGRIPKFKSGKPLSENNFIASKDAAPSMQKLIEEIPIDQFETRNLSKFKEVGKDMQARIICLPTTTLMAMRHITDDRSLSLADFYELGILSHINDKTIPPGELEKGFPSFHREMLDTYLRYALDFADVALQKGVVVLSVDNLFIPDVMNTNLDSSTFIPSRHTELIHGKSGDSIFLSDVTNFRNEMKWETRNIPIDARVIIKFLKCPRLNDSLTRAIILTQDEADWKWIVNRIQGLGSVENINHNPILSPLFQKGIPYALDSVRDVANKGYSQWEIVGKTR